MTKKLDLVDNFLISPLITYSICKNVMLCTFVICPKTSITTYPAGFVIVKSQKEESCKTTSSTVGNRDHSPGISQIKTFILFKRERYSFGNEIRGWTYFLDFFLEMKSTFGIEKLRSGLGGQQFQTFVGVIHA